MAILMDQSVQPFVIGPAYANYFFKIIEVANGSSPGSQVDQGTPAKDQVHIILF